MDIDCEYCGEKDIEQERQDSCSCHICPPCSACTDAPFVCRVCGEHTEYTPPPMPKSTYKPSIAYKPKTLGDLDRSKIDWIHTGKGGRSFHSIHGYTPEGTTQEDVLKNLRLQDRHCLPKFGSFQSGGYFSLTYFID